MAENFFDQNVFKKILKKNSSVLIVEPFYSGAVNNEINNSFRNRNLKIKNISVPFKFLTNYGDKKQHDKKLGFTLENFEKRIKELKKLS